MKFLLTSALIFSVVVVSCSKPSNSGEVKNIFGTDNRQAITTSEFPWRAIGRILIGIRTTCTGTLVTKNFVLTAAHCVVHPDTKQVTTEKITFSPNYVGGLRAGDSSPVNAVWVGTNDPAAQGKHDWAILRLSKSLGETYGWLGAKNNDVASFPDVLTVAGYSNDFKNGQFAGAHINCNTMGRNAAEGLIFHDCDVSPGSSGGPALSMIGGKLTVVGINIAEYRNGGKESRSLPQYDARYANIVIPSGEAVKKALEIIGQN